MNLQIVVVLLIPEFLQELTHTLQSEGFSSKSRKPVLTFIFNQQLAVIFFDPCEVQTSVEIRTQNIGLIMTLYQKIVKERYPEEITLLHMIFPLLLHQHPTPKYRKRKKNTYNCKIRGLLYVSPTSSFLL